MVSARTPWAFSKTPISRASGRGVWKSPNAIRAAVFTLDVEYHRPCRPARLHGHTEAATEARLKPSDSQPQVGFAGPRSRAPLRPPHLGEAFSPGRTQRCHPV